MTQPDKGQAMTQQDENHAMTRPDKGQAMTQQDEDHAITRRANAHDYSQPGAYHITLHVDEEMGQPLGFITGQPEQPDGSPGAPRVVLTPVGEMVQRELLTSIHAHYPMVTIDTHIIMPDHIHFIMVVLDRLLSANGKTVTIGQIIAGFKLGCNRHLWQMMQEGKVQVRLKSQAAAAQTRPQTAAQTAEQARPQTATQTAEQTRPQTATQTAEQTRPQRAEPAATLTTQTKAVSPVSVPGGSAAGISTGTAARPPLFAPGYCDVMPFTREQLETQRTYIRNNPHNRLLRSLRPAWLYTRRATINTAVRLSALGGYLLRECTPSQATPDILEALAKQLLLTNPTPIPPSAPSPTTTIIAPPTTPPPSPLTDPRVIVCDTFGNSKQLEEHRMLPVVCHRKDAKQLATHKARCLEAAAGGTMLVSARIARGEQEIIDDAIAKGYHVMLIADNGFSDRYHPSEQRLAQCASGQLIIATPWRYRYRPKHEAITVAACKAMNCIAQAICRTRDDWWKVPPPPPSR
ncbi:MAG: hypothetical protein IJS59_05630 [Bacteroidaceae bacterium]|nr:hypothetical protein [Bacteroidaceae bacterium]